MGWHVTHIKDGNKIEQRIEESKAKKEEMESWVSEQKLLKTFPEEAKELFAKTEQFAKLRYESYKKLSENK